MNPGIYNIGGSGLQISGNGSMTANGVMLYLSGSAPISLTGNGAVVLNPPTTSTYAGISVFQDENNEASDTFNGNTNLQLDGAI